MDSESERVQRYEARKDDLDEWGEAEKPKSKRRRLASMVSVRLAPNEAATIRAAAQRAGVSVSSFLRSAAMSAARLPEQRATVTVSDSPSRPGSTAKVTMLGAPRDVDLAQVGDTGGVLLATLPPR